MIRKALALAYKDFQIEVGKRTLFTSLFLLSFMLIFLSSYTLNVNPEIRPALSGLVYWLILITIAFQTLNRSLASEEEFGCWDALSLCPVSPKVIYVGKFIYNSFVLIVVQCITFPIYYFFFGLEPSAFKMLIPFSLGSVGFIGIGLLFALFSLKSSGRELITQVSALPVLLPILFIGLSTTLNIAQGATISQLWKQIVYLLSYDLVLITIVFFAFDTTIGE